MRSRLSALLLVLVVGLLPATAWGQTGDTKAPPGLSGADQYLETVPGSDGNSSVGNGQKPNPQDPGVQAAVDGVLPKASVAAARRGGTAADAAALAAQTAPSAKRPQPRPTGPSGPLASAREPTGPLSGGGGGNALATVGRVATGSGGDGMGILFPLLLVAGTLVVAGSALWRRRGGTAP